MYRQPGAYRFAENFPEESATWHEVAVMFRQSPVKEVRNFGRVMADITRCLKEVDDAAESGTVREVRRKLKQAIRAVEAYNPALEKFGTRLAAEELTENGV